MKSGQVMGQRGKSINGAEQIGQRRDAGVRGWLRRSCYGLAVFGLSTGVALAAQMPADAEIGAAIPAARLLTDASGGETRKLPPEVWSIELAQAATGDGAVVPPVKRERPGATVPVAKPAAPSPPQNTPAAPATAETPQAARPGKAETEAVEQAEEKPAKEERAAPESGQPREPQVGGVLAPIQEWLARANREYQGRIVKELSRPAPADLAAEEAKRKAEQAAEAAKQAEARRQAEARAKAEAEAARVAAAKEAEAAKAAAATDAAKAAAEAERKAAAERQAKAVEESGAEAKKQAAAKAAAEAAKLKEAERLADERRKAAAEELRLAEEQRRAAAAEAAARRKAEEEQRAAEAAARDRSEEDAARRAEAKATRETPDERQRHRRWTVTISTEPIDRPEPRTAPDVRSGSEAGILVATRRLQPSMRLGGAVPRGKYKRWQRRAQYCRLAGRKIRLPGRYTVAHGDTLWDISQKHYRNGRHYRRIWRANRRKIANPNLIYPCQKFWLPKKPRR